jgi:hypothetical protein
LEFASFPGEIHEDKLGRCSLSATHLPSHKLEQTIRHFLNLDECFDETLQGRVIIQNLIMGEGDETCMDLADYTPSMWLLYDIMPTLNPYIMDKQFWRMCLDTTLRFKWGHSTTEKIMSHCDKHMIQMAFETWVQNMHSYVYKGRYSTDEQYLRDFNLLRQRSGGLHFVLDGGSLLYIAMRYSWSFTRFRKVLDQAGIDRKQFILDQIACFDDGWTVDSLSTVFDEPPQTIVVSRYVCEVCGHYPNRPYAEVSWQRRLVRIKNDVYPGSPLTQVESEDQADWDQLIGLWKLRVCAECHSKDLSVEPLGVWEDRVKLAEDYAQHWTIE